MKKIAPVFLLFFILGLTCFFLKPEQEIPLIDVDKDGVVDSRDSCIDKHFKGRVDAIGCPLNISKLNFVVDNSASMKGFVKTNGASLKKEVVGYLIPHLGTINVVEELQYYTTTGGALTPYLKTGSMLGAEMNSGKLFTAATSELHEIIGSISKELSKATAEKEAYLLLTDGLLGYAGRAFCGDLPKLKAAVTKAFDPLADQGFVTTLYILQSNFKGNYFPCTGDSKHYSIDTLRPYFLLVIAKQDADKKLAIHALLKENLALYQNMTVVGELGFGVQEGTGALKAMLMNDTAPGTKSATTMINHPLTMDKVRFEKAKGGYSFVLAMDLSALPKPMQDTAYLAQQLQLYTKSGNRIEAELRFLHPQSMKEQKFSPKPGYSHHLLIKTPEKGEHYKLVLNNPFYKFSDKSPLPFIINLLNLPNDGSTYKDSVIGGKVFGLKELVQGIGQGYSNKEGKEHFNIPFKLKK